MEQYNVTGMTCAACQARVEKVVSKVPGVTSVSVSLLTNSMGVEGTALSTDIVAAVEKAGYHASVKGAEKESSQGAEALADTETPKLLKRLIISLIFLMPLMYLSMGHMMWNWPLPGFLNNNHVGMGLAQLLFTVIIMVINQRFFISGFTSLIHRAPNNAESLAAARTGDQNDRRGDAGGVFLDLRVQRLGIRLGHIDDRVCVGLPCEAVEDLRRFLGGVHGEHGEAQSRKAHDALAFAQNCDFIHTAHLAH